MILFRLHERAFFVYGFDEAVSQRGDGLDP